MGAEAAELPAPPWRLLWTVWSSWNSGVFRCGFYGAGIIVTLVIYGLLQERIMQIGYGPMNELFVYSVFLIFCTRCAAIVFASGMILYHGEALRNKAPLWTYVIIGLSNVYASTCQYEALKYISYAVAMLGKSLKMLPVMAWCIIISGKSYGASDWVVALLVTCGVTEFMLTGPKTGAPHPGMNTELEGLLFIAGWLALDGFQSSMQEHLFTKHKTSKYNQMLYINAMGAAVSLATLLVSNTLVPAISFACVHTAFVADAATLSISGVASQWFIYSMVKEFGALAFAATMNVRQIFSIIVSYIVYNHLITLWQVIGLGIVFGTLLYKLHVQRLEQTEKEKEAALLQLRQELTMDPECAPEEICCASGTSSAAVTHTGHAGAMDSTARRIIEHTARRSGHQCP